MRWQRIFFKIKKVRVYRVFHRVVDKSTTKNCKRFHNFSYCFFYRVCYTHSIGKPNPKKILVLAIGHTRPQLKAITESMGTTIQPLFILEKKRRCKRLHFIEQQVVVDKNESAYNVSGFILTFSTTYDTKKKKKILSPLIIAPPKNKVKHKIVKFFLNKKNIFIFCCAEKCR